MDLSVPISKRLIISIFDYSGQWPRPYIKAGYPTMLWDYKKEGCILEGFSSLHMDIEIAIENGYVPWGLMAAPCCTHISKSGAQYWGLKDATPAPEPFGPDWSLTDYASALVDVVLMYKNIYPWAWWVMENPPGRLERIVPHAAKFRAMSFDPCDYGDPYIKKTVLWGEFNTALVKKPVEPEIVMQSSKGRTWRSSTMMAKTGGNTEKTKTIRSNTPMGFARAFFNANP